MNTAPKSRSYSKVPGIPENAQFDALVYLYDLYPTLAELAGVPAPKGIDGFSLVNILNGTSMKSGLPYLLHTVIQ
jgi:arylsulfatase A-like enzyme